jgi:hypothetical protein
MTQQRNTEQRLDGAVLNGRAVSAPRRAPFGSPQNRRWQAEALSAYLSPVFLLLDRPGMSEDARSLPKRLRSLAVKQPDECGGCSPHRVGQRCGDYDAIRAGCATSSTDWGRLSRAMEPSER